MITFFFLTLFLSVASSSAFTWLSVRCVRVLGVLFYGFSASLEKKASLCALRLNLVCLLISGLKESWFQCFFLSFLSALTVPFLLSDEAAHYSRGPSLAQKTTSRN